MSPNFHPVTHVIFDMDGLLLDTEPLHIEATSKVLARYGKEYTLEAKRATLGCTAKEAVEKLISILKVPVSVDQFLAEEEELHDEVFSKNFGIMPGAEKLVQHLKANNVPICIGTSSKSSTFQMMLKYHGTLLGQFHHVVTGSDDPEVKHGKPAPDIFLVAARRFDDKPTDMKDVLVFEDSSNGVKAGLAAGMQVVWVPAPIADRSATNATLILSSLEDFKPELFGLPSY